MTAALNIGARALSANLSALQVIGHNISNVNTEGFSRQSVRMVSSGYQTLGGNYFGKGAELGTVERSHSTYLTREAQLASATSAADQERLQRLKQLENLFPTGETGLGAAVNDMLNAWGDVASSPTNMSARVVALARGGEMASRLSDTASQIDALVYNGRQQAQATVTTVNQLAQDIARINQHIIENQGLVGEPNDLLDQRDALLDQLNREVQTTTIAADDGSLSVFVAGSQPLVLGSTANQLLLQRDPGDNTQSRIAFQQGGIVQPLTESALGGSLGGLMHFLAKDLPAAQNQLGRLALAVNTTVNDQHRLGLDIHGQPGGNYFVPVPDAVATPAVTNVGTAQMRTHVVDATAFMASDYRISFTAGGIEIERLADGVRTLPATLPTELDGLRFEADPGAAVVGNSFVVRPFATAARNLQMALSAPDQLAAASVVAVSPGSANSGGVSIEQLYGVQDLPELTNPVTLSFLANGSFTVAGALNPASPPPDNAGPPPSYNYTPGKPIQFNGWSLSLRGTPSAGDTFALAAAAPGSTPQNSGNARGVLALRDLATFEGVSMTDGYGSLLSNIGTAVQSAQFATDFSSQIAASTDAARQAVSGVNLDEEAARLLQFQQSYQAAAKFLQVAQSSFDTLIRIM